MTDKIIKPGHVDTFVNIFMYWVGLSGSILGLFRYLRTGDISDLMAFLVAGIMLYVSIKSIGGDE